MATAQNVTNWFDLQKCLKGVSLNSERFSLILWAVLGWWRKTGGGSILPPPPPRPGKIGLKSYVMYVQAVCNKIEVWISTTIPTVPWVWFTSTCCWLLLTGLDWFGGWNSLNLIPFVCPVFWFWTATCDCPAKFILGTRSGQMLTWYSSEQFKHLLGEVQSLARWFFLGKGNTFLVSSIDSV